MIKLGIVEDNEKYLNELKNYFSKSTKSEVVFSVSSYAQLQKYYTKKVDIDIFLVDLKLKGKSGIDCIKFIKKESPTVETLMLTIYKDRKSILQAISNGAIGYLMKYETLESIEKSILDVYQGGGAFSSDIAKKLIAEYNPSILNKHESIPPIISPQELKIINFIKAGNTYNEIAIKLGISKNGVKYHLKKIYKKMKVSSRTSLINKASIMGLI